jgi:hypothetical protein
MSGRVESYSKTPALRGLGSNGLKTPWYRFEVSLASSFGARVPMGCPYHNGLQCFHPDDTQWWKAHLLLERPVVVGPTHSGPSPKPASCGANTLPETKIDRDDATKRWLDPWHHQSTNNTSAYATIRHSPVPPACLDHRGPGHTWCIHLALGPLHHVWGWSLDPLHQATVEDSCPSKCRFFKPLVLLGRCWTYECLHRHGFSSNDMCTLCSQSSELPDHLLLQCIYSREVWFKILRLYGWQEFTPLPHDTFSDRWLQSCKSHQTTSPSIWFSNCLCLDASGCKGTTWYSIIEASFRLL